MGIKTITFGGEITMTKSITSQLSDEAIYQILEIIASEIDDIDDKELSITFED